MPTRPVCCGDDTFPDFTRKAWLYYCFYAHILTLVGGDKEQK
jgi:hypothetical protein